MKNKFFYSFVLSLAFALCVGVYHADAATIAVRANQANVSPGDTITASVVVNTAGVAVNDVSGTVQFPTNLLSVIGVSKSTATFPLWVADPTYSNSDGTISFEGGVPTPGYTGSYGTVLTISFRAKAAGTASLTFSGDTAVRANDGMGTDVLSGQQGATISIAQAAEVTPPPATTTTPATSTTTTSTASAKSVVISSTTNPDQTAWYKNTTASFQWTLPSGTDEVRTGLSKDATTLPTFTYSPAITSKTVTGIADGISYFSVRAHTNGTWQKPVTYTVQIDSTAPSNKTATVAYDADTKTLTITSDAKDSTSGIDHYDVYVNGVVVRSIPAGDLSTGTYTLPITLSGDSDVQLVTVDHAGNSVKAEQVIHAPVAPVATRGFELSIAFHSFAHTPVAIGSFKTTLPYGILILLAIIALTVFLTYLALRGNSDVRNPLFGESDFTIAAGLRMLGTIRKRLEKHLEALQEIRRTRMLTKSEKEIKAAIEDDLDTIDKAIEKQKGK